jgi:hypothetical protein
MEFNVFRDAVPCILVGIYRRSGGVSTHRN